MHLSGEEPVKFDSSSIIILNMFFEFTNMGTTYIMPFYRFVSCAPPPHGAYSKFSLPKMAFTQSDIHYTQNTFYTTVRENFPRFIYRTNSFMETNSFICSCLNQQLCTKVAVLLLKISKIVTFIVSLCVSLKRRGR